MSGRARARREKRTRVARPSAPAGAQQTRLGVALATQTGGKGAAGARTGAEGQELADVLGLDGVQALAVGQAQLEREARGRHEACNGAREASHGGRRGGKAGKGKAGKGERADAGGELGTLPDAEG